MSSVVPLNFSGSMNRLLEFPSWVWLNLRRYRNPGFAATMRLNVHQLNFSSSSSALFSISSNAMNNLSQDHSQFFSIQGQSRRRSSVMHLAPNTSMQSEECSSSFLTVAVFLLTATLASYSRLTMLPHDLQPLRQISLSQSKSGSQLTHPGETDSSLRTQEKLRLQASLETSCRRSTWPKDSHLACSPHPILITSQHDAAVRAIHEALVLAIASIVERWWTDSAADFPQRMPLEPGEEALLRWLDTLHPDILPPYPLGSWRPDFLVENVVDPTTTSGTREQFRICEINSRFCWNGFLHLPYGQQALVDLGAETNGFVGAVDPKQFLDSLFTVFDATKPLHLLKGVERGMDIHMFVDFAAQRTGARPIFVLPEDLRLVPDENAKLGYRLCCVVREQVADGDKSKNYFLHNGEMLEEIHQVSLELCQHELRALSPEMMRALSVRCFNDMRTIFLVHDKRMLGIVLQELDDLVHRGTLSATQAEILRAGICPTILAGSREAALFLQQCRDSPTHKDGYVLKLIRSGKGAGIVFGDEVTAAEWDEMLEQYLCDAAIAVDQPAYLVQRQIIQRRYEVLLRDGEQGVQANYLIGTYHAIHGQYLGIGTWRSGPGRVCALSHGGAWICSVKVPGC
ncbi:Circularly permuted ATP-grasp type 2 [Mycena sanguinolenta]|uniref:Circularly permuted ATP-grasp type 2 n=1 Tax=Mycena sanguinolenta TaxID=230812 RepID=A0A8H6XW42_9AGAR|nr:Circularly permuted ATP-grasp type 2 [Mycena sanguinolenta]